MPLAIVPSPLRRHRESCDWMLGSRILIGRLREEGRGVARKILLLPGALARRFKRNFDQRAALHPLVEHSKLPQLAENHREDFLSPDAVQDGHCPRREVCVHALFEVKDELRVRPEVRVPGPATREAREV